MDFNEYQSFARNTAIYPPIIVKITETQTADATWVYPLTGLEGEVGELANKLKKVIRDSNFEISFELRQKLGDEIGDVMWYISELCVQLHLNLDTVAKKNIEKLLKRKEQNLIKGEGDERSVS